MSVAKQTYKFSGHFGAYINDLTWPHCQVIVCTHFYLLQTNVATFFPLLYSIKLKTQFFFIDYLKIYTHLHICAKIVLGFAQ